MVVLQKWWSGVDADKRDNGCNFHVPRPQFQQVGRTRPHSSRHPQRQSHTPVAEVDSASNHVVSAGLEASPNVESELAILFGVPGASEWDNGQDRASEPGSGEAEEADEDINVQPP